MTTHETYVVQWQRYNDKSWVDQDSYEDVDAARAMRDFFASVSRGFHDGPWRIIHRVTAIVEKVVE